VNISLKQTLSGHSSAIYALHKLSNHEILSAGADGFVVLWDLNKENTGKAIIHVPGVVYSFCLMAGSPNIWVGTDLGIIHCVDGLTGKEIKAIKTDLGGVFSMKQLKNGYVISTHGSGHLAFWDSTSGQLIKVVKISDQKIRDFAINVSETHLIIACSDNHIYVYDLLKSVIQTKFEAHFPACNTVVIHPNKPWIISGGRDAHIQVWDWENNFDCLMKIPAHNYAIYSLAFSPNKQWLLSASRDKTCKIWLADDLSLIKRITPENTFSHTYSINQAIWIDDERFAAAGDDRLVRIWQIGE